MPLARARRQQARLLTLALFVLGLLLAGLPATPAATQGVPPPGVQVAIADGGFQPQLVTVEAGQSIHWTNSSSQARSVVAGSGLFDSGSLPPGAGYSLALATPGDHAYSSPTGGFSGAVRVQASTGGLSGPPNDKANDHIPKLPFPPITAGQVSVHPVLGVDTSRVHLLAAFTKTATVTQANTALQAAGLTIVGGLPKTGILMLAVPDQGDFASVEAAWRTMRTSSVVAAVSLIPRMEETVVPPAAERRVEDIFSWRWRTPPDGGNWNLEASRVPQAWNLLEAIRRRGHRVSTGIVDSGFQAHRDLPSSQFSIETFCHPESAACLADEVKDHGNHVAGIIGAAFDNSDSEPGRSLGISGVNPVARIHAMNWKTQGDFLPIPTSILELTLDEKEAGRLPDLRVINISLGWANRPFIDEYAIVPSLGYFAFLAAERAAPLRVVFVVSAGNDGVLASRTSQYAWAAEHWDRTRPADPNPIIVVESIGLGLTRPADSNFGGAIAAPGERILSTASTLGDRCGVPDIISDAPYCVLSGTSQAAPHVTGLVGYLLAFDPTLTIEELRTALVDWAQSAETPGAARRLDAFASLLSLPHTDTGGKSLVARALVDVSDPSKDGNRRVKYGPNGATVGLDVDMSRTPPYRTEPDGSIDMRDFRRFRDAWLASCLAGPGLTAECPADADIGLDGEPDHPKRDLNFDGCSAPQAPSSTCPTPEWVYPRFDFNGNGRVSRDEKAKVPLHSDGSPAASPGGAAEMTDLDVMKALWEPNVADTEGWAARDLDALMRSGDLEVHADDFFDGGAENVVVRVSRKDPGGELATPARVLEKTETERFIVVTVPLTATDPTEVEVRASAVIGGKTVLAQPKKTTLKAGEDKRLDLCRLRFAVNSSTPSLRADGASTATLTAALTTCGPTTAAPSAPTTAAQAPDGAGQGPTVPGDPSFASLLAQSPGGTEVAAPNIPLTFELTPSGPGHATLSATSGTTDANGKLTTTVTAGTLAADYTLTSSTNLDSIEQMSTSTTIRVEGQIKVAYAWQQTNLEWFEDYFPRDSTHPLSTACSNPPNPDKLDCYELSRRDLIAVNAQGAPARLSRSGTLTMSGTQVLLSEEVGSQALSIEHRRRLSALVCTGPLGTCPESFPFAWGTPFDQNSTGSWNVLPEDLRRYQNHVLPGSVTIQERPDGVTLGGLNAVAELGYRHRYSEVRHQLGASRADPIRPEFLLIPRGDGSALQYGPDTSRPIEFPRGPNGSLAPYGSCSTVERDLTWPADQFGATRLSSPWLLDGELQDGLVPHPNAGQYPLPPVPSRLRIRYAFIAQVFHGDQPPPLTLPDCSTPGPPVADFAFTSPVDEGSPVHFFDRSTDPDFNQSGWSWDFGDGTTTSSERNPLHTFKDNGSYSVKLTVTDENGSASTITKNVAARNLPPTAELDDAHGQQGQELQITFRIGDPGELDRADLRFKLSSIPQRFQDIEQGGLAAGSYTINLNLQNAQTGDVLTLTV